MATTNIHQMNSRFTLQQHTERQLQEQHNDKVTHAGLIQIHKIKALKSYCKQTVAIGITNCTNNN